MELTPRFPRTEVKALPEVAVPVFEEIELCWFWEHFLNKMTPMIMTAAMIRMVLKLNFEPPEEELEELEELCEDEDDEELD